MCGSSKGDQMKNILIGLLALGSISVMASTQYECKSGLIYPDTDHNTIKVIVDSNNNVSVDISEHAASKVAMTKDISYPSPYAYGKLNISDKKISFKYYRGIDEVSGCKVKFDLDRKALEAALKVNCRTLLEIRKDSSLTDNSLNCKKL